LISDPDLETMYQAVSKNLFLYECDFSWSTWQNLTQESIRKNQREYTDSCTSSRHLESWNQSKHVDHQPRLFFRSPWFLILSQLFVEIKHLKPGSSWSWSSVISINNQCLDRMSLPVLAYKQSVQILSCLSAEPVRGACLDIMLKWRIYQFSLLSSKHYILKKMNPTTTVFLVQRVYSSASIIGVVLVRIL